MMNSKLIDTNLTDGGSTSLQIGRSPINRLINDAYQNVRKI